MFQVLGSVREPVDLSPKEALDSAEALMTQQGYNVTERTETSVTAVRRKREGMFGHSLRDLTVVAQPLPEGGVEIKLRGSDREGVRDRQTEWSEWGKSLPMRKEDQGEQRPKEPRAWRRRRRTQGSSGASKTPDAAQESAESNEEPDVGGAHEQETPEGEVGGGERRDAPTAEPERWSSVAPWNQGPRVAASKQTANPILPKSRSSNASESSSGDALQHGKSSAQEDKDRDDYRTLLDLYSEGLDLVERFYAAEGQHAYVISQKSDVKHEYEEDRRSAYEQIEGLLEDMGKLAERIPDFAGSGLAFRRTELEARRRSIEREAKEQRRAAGPPKPSAEQMNTDREDHRKLLGLYPQYLGALEETYSIDQSDPTVQQQIEETRQTAFEGIEDVRRKLDVLEERTPDLATGTSAERRARLENQWKEIRGRDDQTSIPRGSDFAETQRTEMGKGDERANASEQSSEAEIPAPDVPQEEQSGSPEGEVEELDTATLRSDRPSRGGSMSGRAAGEGDLSNLIERVEPFEDRLGVRLEGLFARSRSHYIEVNGELYARGGDKLNQDIELVVTVYDASGRVIAVNDNSFYADEFFGFEPFSIFSDVEGMQPARIRVHPRTR